MSKAIHIPVRNVNSALTDGLWRLRTGGVVEQSRNGPVLVMPGPVITEYKRPRERVLFHTVRDANPVFHLLESLWMLAGRRDAAWLLPFNSNMATYAEEDGYFHGAYGARWRSHFGFDQLIAVAEELHRDPQSRRAVVAMWNPGADLGASKKDLPCNTHIYFDCRRDVLNMTVCCRSNDAVWGAYGANAVHFSILQEVVAALVGVPVGTYYQMSNNFHVYTDNPTVKQLLEHPSLGAEDLYITGQVKPALLIREGETARDFLDDCQSIVAGQIGFKTLFFITIAEPLRAAYLERKEGRPIGWDSIDSSDWKTAFRAWVARRDNKGAK